MRVWIYCYSYHEHQLDERETKMLKFASERRMEVIDVTKALPTEECLKDVLKEISKVQGDGIVIYDMEELPFEDRMLLIDYMHQRKVTIFCCKYAGKEVN